MFKKKPDAPPNNDPTTGKTNDDEAGGTKTPDKPMSLIEHLRELRIRVMYGMYFFGVVFVVCYGFSDVLLDFIKHPIEKPLAKYTNQVVFETNEEQTADYPLDCRCKKITQDETTPQSTDDDLKMSELFGNLSFTPKKEMNSSSTPTNALLSCHCEKADVAPKKSPLVFISITEVFMSELKAALFAAIFFSVPFFFIQIGIFVIPALFEKEKKIFMLFTTIGYVFFIVGALFGYLVVFPFGFDFFLGLTTPGEIVPFISVANYLSFSLTMLFFFGLVFELPLVIFVVVRLGLATPQFFIKNFKYFFVGITLVSAILTPPDPMSLILMALPLTVLYGLGILLSFLAVKKQPTV